MAFLVPVLPTRFLLGYSEYQVGIMVSLSGGMLSVSGKGVGVSGCEGAGRDSPAQACFWILGVEWSLCEPWHCSKMGQGRLDLWVSV